MSGNNNNTVNDRQQQQLLSLIGGSTSKSQLQNQINSNDNGNHQNNKKDKNNDDQNEEDDDDAQFEKMQVFIKNTRNNINGEKEHQHHQETTASAEEENHNNITHNHRTSSPSTRKQKQQSEVIDPLTHFATKIPAIREMNDLYLAATWESAFSAFAKIQKHPSTNQETLTHALSLAAAHTWKWPKERKEQVQPQFEAVSNRLRLPPATKNLFTMLLHSDEAASEKFLKMTNEERSQLPRFMVERYSKRLFDNNFQSGTWEQNLQYLNDMKSLRQDSFMRMESLLLRSIANPRNLCWQPTRRSTMTEIVQNLEHQCRTKMSQLGRQHAVVLMYAFARLHGFNDVRRIFNEMKERNDLDEEIAAAFIRISNTATIEATIPELRKSTVNVLSSSCTRAIVYSMCQRGESSAAIETMRAFATVPPAEEWSVQDLRAAVTACNKHMYPNRDGNNKDQQQSQTVLPPDAGIVDTILSGAMATWTNAEVACPRVTNFLVLSLLTLGRTQDVLSIAKTICNPQNFKILDRMNEQAFDALNSTLASANLPQREASEKRKQIQAEIQMKRQAREAAQQGMLSSSSSASSTTANQNIQDPWTAASTSTSQQQQSTSSSSSTSLVPPHVSEKMLSSIHSISKITLFSSLLLLQQQLLNNKVLPTVLPSCTTAPSPLPSITPTLLMI